MQDAQIRSTSRTSAFITSDKIVFVVPFEGIDTAWHKGDVNYHLYTWSPMNLGNLFTEAGFVVESVAPIWHRWPPMYRTIARVNWTLFDYSARIWARLGRGRSQVGIVARKPAPGAG